MKSQQPRSVGWLFRPIQAQKRDLQQSMQQTREQKTPRRLAATARSRSYSVDDRQEKNPLPRPHGPRLKRRIRPISHGPISPAMLQHAYLLQANSELPVIPLALSEPPFCNPLVPLEPTSQSCPNTPSGGGVRSSSPPIDALEQMNISNERPEVVPKEPTLDELSEEINRWRAAAMTMRSPPARCFAPDAVAMLASDIDSRMSPELSTPECPDYQTSSYPATLVGANPGSTSLPCNAGSANSNSVSITRGNTISSSHISTFPALPRLDLSRVWREETLVSPRSISPKNTAVDCKRISPDQSKTCNIIASPRSAFQQLVSLS